MDEMRWGMWTVIIAGLIWGLVGLGYFFGTNLNVINLIFGSWPAVESIVYIIVGICAVWVAWLQMQRK